MLAPQEARVNARIHERVMLLADSVRQRLSDWLAKPRSDKNAQLDASLRLLSKWRSALIQNTVQHHNGTRIWSGPFEGMDFLPQSTHGCHIAKLIGCYEQPLQPFIEAAIRAAYPVVLNIGCAEGYYTVGMARRMPATQVHAFDIDPAARRVCGELAASRGVADRVRVGERFTTDDFAAYAGHKTLVLCDIEGAEKELLDPQAAPALRGMDLIVESHDCLVPGITRLLIDRFKHCHEITVVEDSGDRRLPKVPPWFTRLGHLDQLLATWDWRAGPTPWLVLKSRQEPDATESGA